ncbi:inositol monophosphatase 1-like isoform X4 [Trachinotus anak]|uniref:inositol monophosphatase 1-like isoform X4 n=1 Tax=Trachinotus anak TaxID=443729 RepID=UPI0039F22D9F
MVTHKQMMVREALLKDIAVMQKSSPVDLVTETDQKVEQLIISSIKEKYPTHSFIGEESVAAGAPSVLTDNPTWIIDPIDGTTNFVHRFPFVSISIGFTVKKEVSDRVWDCLQLHRGQNVHGTERERSILQRSPYQSVWTRRYYPVSGTDRNGFQEGSRAVQNNAGQHQDHPHHPCTWSKHPVSIHRIRSPGSAAVNMCLVACGSADAYYHMGIHCWDMAGGAVVVTEAGGVIMDISGGPFDLMSRRLIVASSRAIAERIVKEIKEFNVGRDDTDN